jgi:hypothetical protein
MIYISKEKGKSMDKKDINKKEEEKNIFSKSFQISSICY